ncbi:hypothetical protein ABLU22_01500 [Acinetobacter lwoffii]|uniref:hypothetical protein n=1 Tax=Acinetobacter lwoffii TaxID=28090 RepID=UPI0032B53B4C
MLSNQNIEDLIKILSKENQKGNDGVVASLIIFLNKNNINLCFFVNGISWVRYHPQ